MIFFDNETENHYNLRQRTEFGIFFLQSLSKLNLLTASKNQSENVYQQIVPVDFVGLTLMV